MEGDVKSQRWPGWRPAYLLWYNIYNTLWAIYTNRASWRCILLPEFRNEPLTDFSDPANVAAFQSALDAVRRNLGRTYPMVIDGQQITSAETFDSINPSCPSEVVARFPLGTVDHADQAVEAARCAFVTWQHTPAEERSALLMRVAGEMRRRKHEFSATMVYEVGKPWVEADADTAEAIDFLEYYARQILEIADSSSKLVTRP